MPWVDVCLVDDLREGLGKFVETSGRALAVFLHEGKHYVLDNECPHAGASLAGGSIQNGCCICPWHYWAFRLSDGRMPDNPTFGVHSYSTRIVKTPRGMMLQAQLPEKPPALEGNQSLEA